MIKVQLSDADRKEVVKYRLEKANRTYQEAVGSIKICRNSCQSFILCSLLCCFRFTHFLQV